MGWISYSDDAKNASYECRQGVKLPDRGLVLAATFLHPFSISLAPLRPYPFLSPVEILCIKLFS